MSNSFLTIIIITMFKCEANRQMYRSLMEQVARFLDRVRKSLDKLPDKAAPCKARYNSSVLLDKSSRVPRSRSVHAVHANDDAPVRLSCASSTTSSSSSSSTTSSSSSRFARAKSVAQISTNNGAINPKDVTWSMHRRQEMMAKAKAPQPPPVVMSKSAVDVTEVAYRRPKTQPEMDPDDVPPEKLSQEAFR